MTAAPRAPDGTVAASGPGEPEAAGRGRQGKLPRMCSSRPVGRKRPRNEEKPGRDPEVPPRLSGPESVSGAGSILADRPGPSPRPRNCDRRQGRRFGALYTFCRQRQSLLSIVTRAHASGLTARARGSAASCVYPSRHERIGGLACFLAARSCASRGRGGGAAGGRRRRAVDRPHLSGEVRPAGARPRHPRRPAGPLRHLLDLRGHRLARVLPAARLPAGPLREPHGGLPGLAPALRGARPEHHLHGLRRALGGPRARARRPVSAPRGVAGGPARRAARAGGPVPAGAQQPARERRRSSGR